MGYMKQTIDLRSDTVTKPSPIMREVIAKAPVGDDQFGEDPSVNLLQERVASLLKKESALWLPTGTMANQVALRVLTQPGDDVIVGEESHAVWHETGASGANAGVQFTAIGKRGLFTPEEYIAAVKPLGHIIYPPTTLVEIENTHNRGGGTVFPQEDAVRICNESAKRGIAAYLDGARLWNAAIASGKEPSELAEPFDLVSVALSKGLGAPGGSLLAGSGEIIKKCVRYRRMLGGAMRQAGIFAAAGLYAIENNIGRLAEDHNNAKLIAEKISTNRKIQIDLKNVQTNILVFNVTDDAPLLVKKAGEKGLLIFAFGPHTIRAVTHLDVTSQQCEEAADIILEILGK
jgi:threonine aldolase